MRKSIVFLMIVVFLALWTNAYAESLKITSFPSGAKVIVDGTDTEKFTPVALSLLEGVHTVTVHISGSGWSVETSDVTIVSGDNYLSVNLAPMFVSGAE
jgi:hypothetical protein